MTKQQQRDYASVHGTFSLEIPSFFNFGTDVVDRWAQDPERQALIAVDAHGRERRYSYHDISQASNRVAAMLRALGVTQGDRVLIMLPRIPEWQIVVVACLKLGAVAVPCVTMLTAHDLEYRITHSGASAVVTTAGHTHKFDNISVAVRIAVGDAPTGWTPLSAADDLDDHIAAATVAAEDPAVIYYTSGSTGMPKGVTHASRALYAWRTSAEYWLSLDDGDVMWCTADTGWSKAGTSILFGPWSRGATVLFYDGPFDPVTRLDLLERYRVNVFCAAATEFRQLVHADAGARDLDALRLSVSAGESVNPEIVVQWRNQTGSPLLDGYGQSETLMTVVNYPFLRVKPGSMGKPLPGVVMGVRTADGVGVTGALTGELVLKAPNPQLMLGYWNDPDRTDASFEIHEGTRWFRTGDLVSLDEDGYLTFEGRKDDVINSSGYRIGPQEVENALVEHSAVAEAAVVGVPDDLRGEIVKAFIVLRAGYKTSSNLVADLQRHTREHTAPYKYPRAIEFINELPKTATGKIRRNALRARFSPD
ncbi:AMP-binding protein [Rhodococcus pyridinivorans]|uniref:acyl-CoA synthetase n=1 Tax=Rhodococcus pyridinivorans TaxID=103816 RepID=UPI001E5BF808|nr:AMP-binding protein [Rhodococcus pyridinivorans]MCD5422444.1 AMP-binding protein [Rhodococcus pyridinivorans]